MNSRLGLALAITFTFVFLASLFAYMLRSGLDDDSVAVPQEGTDIAGALADATDAFPPFEGFTEAYVSLADRCLRVVVADESDERVQGLRGVSDLAPYDGMLFVFDEDTDARFTMADTLIALDIGWYDWAGAPIDRTTMQPCPEDETDCPPYAARGRYRYALETAPGDGGPGVLGACAAS